MSRHQRQQHVDRDQHVGDAEEEELLPSPVVVSEEHRRQRRGRRGAPAGASRDASQETPTTSAANQNALPIRIESCLGSIQRNGW